MEEICERGGGGTARDRETDRRGVWSLSLKGIYPEFQVIRGFSQKIPAGLLSYDQIHS